MSMLEDEQEARDFLLREEFEMSIRHIDRLQAESASAYNRVPQSEAAAWAQVIAQCEIAQQLARIATQLEDGQIATLEGRDIVERLERIGNIIDNRPG